MKREKTGQGKAVCDCPWVSEGIRLRTVRAFYHLFGSFGSLSKFWEIQAVACVELSGAFVNRAVVGSNIISVRERAKFPGSAIGWAEFYTSSVNKVIVSLVLAQHRIL